MSYRYFDKIEMHPNYPYSSSFHTKTRRALLSAISGISGDY
jgi:hypothetical protein